MVRWMFAPCASCHIFKSPSLAGISVINATAKRMSGDDQDSTQLVYFRGGRGVKGYRHQEKIIQGSALRKNRRNSTAQKMTRRSKYNSNFTLRSFGATRASREVCLKHRNIRRENQRVRCNGGETSVYPLWRGKGDCSLKLAVCAEKPPGKCSATCSNLVPEATPRFA